MNHVSCLWLCSWRRRTSTVRSSTHLFLQQRHRHTFISLTRSTGRRRTSEGPEYWTLWWICRTRIHRKLRRGSNRTSGGHVGGGELCDVLKTHSSDCRLIFLYISEAETLVLGRFCIKLMNIWVSLILLMLLQLWSEASLLLPTVRLNFQLYSGLFSVVWGNWPFNSPPRWRQTRSEAWTQLECLKRWREFKGFADRRSSHRGVRLQNQEDGTGPSWFWTWTLLLVESCVSSLPSPMFVCLSPPGHRKMHCLDS